MRTAPYTRLLILLAGLFVTASPVFAGIRSFRYDLSTKSGDAQFAGEITVSPEAVIKRYDIQYDDSGRIKHVDFIEDGKKIGATNYIYSGTSSLADGYEYFNASEETGTSKVQREDNGDMKRVDYYTLQGVLTGYNLYVRNPDAVEETDYTAEGAETERDVRSFSPDGILAGAKVYTNGSKTSYTEFEYDVHTGQKTSGKQFNDGKLANTQKYSYDANGDLTRRDAYDQSGKWFAANEFANGLNIRRIYEGVNGHTGKVIEYSYDEKRLLTAAKVSYDNKWICTLVYDRLPDETVKRTLAKGPDGELWAEYPNRMVRDVGSDGQQPTQTDAILHHPAPWW